MKDFFSALNAGIVAGHKTDTQVESKPWNAHPTFDGVAIKHLVTGAETDGQFSAHLVRIDPGSIIDDHTHESNWELHEVATGSGYCVLNDRQIPYAPGVTAIIPQGMPHQVQAGEEELQLLAKFVPALL